MATVSLKDIRDTYKEMQNSLKSFISELDGSLVKIKTNAEAINKSLSGFSAGSTAEIDELNKRIAELEKLAKERDETDQKRAKTKKKLQDLTDAELKLRLKEQEEFKQRKKDLQTEIVLEQKLIKNRKNLLAQNKALAAQRDKLDIDTQADEIRALNDQIDRNNELLVENGDQNVKRAANVGKYTEGIREALNTQTSLGDSFKELNLALNVLSRLYDRAADGIQDYSQQTDDAESKTKKFGRTLKNLGITAIIAAFSAFAGAFASSRAGSKELRESLAGLQATFKVLTKSLAQAALAAFNFIKTIRGQMAFGLAAMKKQLLELSLTILTSTNAFGVNDEAIKKTTKSLAQANTELGSNLKAVQDGIKAQEDFAKAFENFGDRVDEAKKSILEQIKLEDQLIDTTENLRIRISELSKEEEKFRALEGENAASFADRIDATEKLIKVNKERTALSVDLAREELRLVEAEIAADKAASGLGDQYRKSKEQSERYTEAVVQLNEALSEQGTSAIEARTLLTQLALDVLERDLDILIDGYDRQKTINEQRLNNDRITLEEKKRILAELDQAQRDFVANSQEAFNKEFSDILKKTDEELKDIFKIDNDEDLSALKKQLDLIKNEVELKELAQTLDEKGSKALRDEIRDLTSNETLEGRILEFVQNIAQFKQDNLDTTRQIKDETEEIARLEADIAEQERILAGENAEESKRKRLQDTIDLIDEQLKEVEVGSKKELELQKEKNAALIELDRQKTEEQKKLQKELIDFASEITDDFYDNQLSKIDKQIQKSEENEDRIRDAIDKGSKLGEKALSQEISRQEELDKQKQKLEKRQLQAQALLASFEAYNANDGNLGETFSDLTLLKQFAKTLPTYFVGSDDIGKASNGLDSNGGRLVVAHDNEQIWSYKDRADVGFRTRDEIKELVKLAETNPFIPVGTDGGNDMLLNEVRTLNKNFKDLPKKMPVPKVLMKREFVEEEVRRGNRIQTDIKRANTVWQ